MKTICFSFAAFLLVTGHIFAQQGLTLDLHKTVKSNGISVSNRQLVLLDERSCIRLDKREGEGVAWIDGVSFANGIIEFEVRGENVKQHSFVGIAFHGLDDLTYDAVYLRPF